MIALALALSLTTTPRLDGMLADITPAWDGRTRTIHEWGTFTSVQGSNGVTLDGLRHHERDLPKFVNDLLRAGGVVSLSPKMETPVAYFYAPARWKLELSVRFPHGLVTQWYPPAAEVNEPCERNAEALSACCAEPAKLANGFIRWGVHDDLTILPPGTPAELPPIEAGDPWQFTREVAAGPLYVCDLPENVEPRALQRHYERFLFYRGLGNFALPLTAAVQSETGAGTQRELRLRLSNAVPSEALRGLFLVYVEDGQAAFQRLADLQGSRDAAVKLELAPVADTTAALVASVSAELVRHGLFADEARAMARTWARGWFGDAGLRVLYVLPRDLIERELPLEAKDGFVYDETARTWVDGTPQELVRVFVGRTEILTPKRERELEQTIRRSAAGDIQARAEIEHWGRFAAPWLERVRALSQDERVRAEVAARLAEIAARG